MATSKKSTKESRWLRKIANEVEKNPKMWQKRSAARSKNGYPVKPQSKQAVSWCAWGFVLRDWGFKTKGATACIMNALAAETRGISTKNYPCPVSRVIIYNDRRSRTVAQFVNWFRKAANRIDISKTKAAP